MRGLKWLVLALWASSAAAQTYPSPTFQNVTDRAATLNHILLGGGTGAPIAPLGSLGTTTTLLHGNAAGVPSFASVDLAADVGASRLPFANLVQGATNTVPANVTAGTADFAAFSMPSCDTATKALQWTTNTGFVCNSAIQATTAATNSITNAMLAQMASNTVKANATNALANASDFSMPSCSTSSSALTWTTNTGFTCNSSINAATLIASTWASPPAIGSTTPNAGSFSTLSAGVASTSTGTLTLANAGSAFTTTLQAGVNITASRTYTWPTNFGAAGTVLTDAAGNGTLSWTAAGTGTVTNVATAGALTGGPITTTGTISPTAGPTNIRVTLTTGVPVLTSTVSGATTTYCTPYNGNLIPVWNGSTFISTPFTEMSQATTDATKSPAAVAASQVYDLFVWNDAGTLRCTRGPTWASGTGGSNTVRGTGAGGTALTRVNGILVNAAAITNGPGAGAGTYVGTIASNGSSAIDWIYGGSSAGGTASVLNVWNNYNRVTVTSTVSDSTASWTYASAAWRSADNSTGNRVTFVCGMSEDMVTANYVDVIAGSASASAMIGIGLNSTSAVSGVFGGLESQSAGNTIQFTATYGAACPLGSNFIQALEYSAAATSTYNGNAGNYGQGLLFYGRM